MWSTVARVRRVSVSLNHATFTSLERPSLLLLFRQLLLTPTRFPVRESRSRPLPMDVLVGWEQAELFWESIRKRNFL